MTNLSEVLLTFLRSIFYFTLLMKYTYKLSWREILASFLPVLTDFSRSFLNWKVKNMWFLESHPKGALRKKYIKYGNEIKSNVDIFPKLYTPFEKKFEEIEEFAEFLDDLRTYSEICLVMGKPKSKDIISRSKENFIDANHNWLILDIDHLSIPQPEKVLNTFPKILQITSCICALTSSYGVGHKFSMRFFYRTDNPILLSEQQKIAEYIDSDTKIYQPNRLIFTADPIGLVPNIDDRILIYEKENDVLKLKSLWRDIGAPKDLAIEKEKAINRIRSAQPNKERNNKLLSEATKLCGLWLDNNKDPSELFEDLKKVGLEIGLEEKETIICINQALKYSEDNQKNKKIKDRFYDYICSLNPYKIRSEDNGYFIRLNNEVIKIDMLDRECKDWLTYLYKDTFNKIPEFGDVNAVINALMSDISREPFSQVSLRTAVDSFDTFAINQNEKNEHIRITPSKIYKISGEPDNAFFINSKKQGNLPDCKKTDLTLIQLFKILFPGLDRRQLLLISCWLMGAVEPTINYPILTLTGIHNSGKSTLAATLKYCIDPAKGNLSNQINSEPKTVEDLYTIASNKHVTVIDNMSYIDQKFSDALAVISTGGVSQARALYTNNDVAEKRLRKPIIITSINQVAKSSDLADRAVSIDLQSFKYNMSEQSFLRKVKHYRPYILYCLYKGLSKRLGARDIKIQNVHRMRGWIQTIIAASRYIGSSPKEIYNTIIEDRKNIVAELLETDSLASALINLAESKEVWIGTINELESLLTVGFINTPKDWPKTPNAFARRLKMIQPNLKNIYRINLICKRVSHNKIYIVTRNEDKAKRFLQKNFRINRIIRS